MESAASIRPRPLRLTLGVMMALVAVLGIALGLIARKAHTQRDTVAAIRGAGGVVAYDDTKRPGPKWLRDLLGVDAFDTVERVVLNRETLDDDLLIRVAGLEGLQVLSIGGGDPHERRLQMVYSPSHRSDRYSPLSPRALSELRKLKRLTGLIIDANSSDVAKGIVPYLDEFESLSLLYLTVDLSDSDMRRIASLSRLRVLSLGGGQLTDAGLMLLSRLKGLSQFFLLGLGRTTKEGQEQLRKALPNLRFVVHPSRNPY